MKYQVVVSQTANQDLNDFLITFITIYTHRKLQFVFSNECKNQV